MKKIKILKTIGFIACVGGWFWMVRESYMLFVNIKGPLTMNWADNNYFEYALCVFLAGACVYVSSSRVSVDRTNQESNKIED